MNHWEWEKLKEMNVLQENESHPEPPDESMSAATV